MKSYQNSQTNYTKMFRVVEPLSSLLNNLPFLETATCYNLSMLLEPKKDAKERKVWDSLEVGERAQVIEFLVENFMNDAQWKYVTSNKEKRRSIIKVILEHQIQWCSTNTNYLFLKYASDTKNICAVAFFKDSSTSQLPLTTLMKSIGALNLGNKVNTKVFATLNGVESSTAAFAVNWELIYFGVTQTYIQDIQYWRTIFSIADNTNQIVWTHVTDPERLELVKSLGFDEVHTCWCVDNKVPIWILVRQPRKEVSYGLLMQQYDGTIDVVEPTGSDLFIRVV